MVGGGVENPKAFSLPHLLNTFMKNLTTFKSKLFRSGPKLH